MNKTFVCVPANLASFQAFAEESVLEERRLGNDEDLPMHWVKVEAEGFPHYVNGYLTTDRARGGNHRLRHGGPAVAGAGRGGGRLRPRRHQKRAPHRRVRPRGRIRKVSRDSGGRDPRVLFLSSGQSSVVGGQLFV